MTPLYPNVPIALGVPAVFRRAEAKDVAKRTVAKSQASTTARDTKKNSIWGVYDSKGKLALAVDSVLSIEPLLEYHMEDYPIEQGGFQTYNKVKSPGMIRFVVAKAGSDQERSKFLARVDELIAAIKGYNIVTPDSTFLNYSLLRRDYKRSSEGGISLLKVEIQAKEVRETAKASFTDSTDASGNDPVNNGSVQPVTPTADQTPPAGAIK
jgi:hypothetical protein